MPFNPINHTGKTRLRDKKTGLYLVAPVSAWRHECEPEWTDIPECAFRFSKAQAGDQKNYLYWNLKIQAETTA